jgi:hypothetical protein
VAGFHGFQRDNAPRVASLSQGKCGLTFIGADINEQIDFVMGEQKTEIFCLLQLSLFLATKKSPEQTLTRTGPQ